MAETTTLRAYDDDVDRLDALNRRDETYADTLSRLLDTVEDSAEPDAQPAN